MNFLKYAFFPVLMALLISGACFAQADSTGTASGDGVVASERGIIIHRTTLTLTDVAVTLVDNAGTTAYGSLKVYDMPAGAIKVLGVTASLNTAATTLGVDVDAAGDFGLGTVAANNTATPLATTEQNLIANTALTFADVDNLGAEDTTAYTSLIAAAFDGTSTAMDVYVNFLIDDADHDVTTTPCDLTLNGTITFTWVNLGDY